MSESSITTWPLEQLDLEGAKELQFRLVEAIARHIDGRQVLQGGDYGIWPDTGRPHSTALVEAVLADFFGAEQACLVRGAGTGALRSIMLAALKPGQKLLVHRAPVYPTTAVTIRGMGLELITVDLNHLEGLRERDLEGAECALVQHTRQRIQDRYRLAEVLAELRGLAPAMMIIVDENYAALRVSRIGIQLGADVSTCSLFKLLGPEGLGLILGRAALIDEVRRQNYSGGTQVQGTEAMDALRVLALAPVALAVQAQVVDEVARRLNSGQTAGVARAYVANAQSRVVLVELEKPQAHELLEKSWQYGAAGHPVGAESRYEVAPLFYRISGTFRQEEPSLAERMIRINPMRAGADLVISILEKSLRDCQGG